MSSYSASRISRIFSSSQEEPLTKLDLIEAENQKSWGLKEIPALSKKYGFLKKKTTGPVVATFFITKGGVLKSSLCLNFARLCALHNLRTCVIGLDIQGDITSSLGYETDLTEDHNLTEALQILSETRGLANYFFKKDNLQNLIVGTDLPNLFLIPETAELVAMEKSLNLRNKREYFLKNEVVEKIKTQFDVILFDASPNWNNLITNALVASDFLISPLECKINNFRNLQMFKTFIADFKQDLQINFKHIFVPTRFSPQRKLSREILQWYQKNLPGVTKYFVKDSVQGEEAVAMKLSVPEYVSTKAPALEMNQLIKEIWELLEKPVLKKPLGEPSDELPL